METWDLDHTDTNRLRALLQHDLLRWGADAGGDLTLAIKGAEGSLRARPLSEPHDDGNDLLACIWKINTLLHGDQGDQPRTLAELVPDIEHLVKRCWELQDRVVELERGTK